MYLARPYSSDWLRFLTPDPLGIRGGSNPYRLVGNNPISNVDPYGLSWLVSPTPFPGQDSAQLGPYAFHVDDGYDWIINAQPPSYAGIQDQSMVVLDTILLADGVKSLFDLGAWAGRKMVSKCATDGALQTTAHGAERIAGAAATRGGVLSEAGVTAVRQGGRVMTQADGATVRILQNEAGRFNVVVEGERGIITTFENLSQKSLDRLGRNYGWK